MNIRKGLHSRKKKLVPADERRKVKLPSEYEVPCPFCEGPDAHDEILWFIGPWHSPKYMVKCRNKQLTSSGWGRKGEASFEDMLRGKGYDPVEVKEVRRTAMRLEFAPPEKKVALSPEKQAKVTARLERLRALKAEKQAEKPEEVVVEDVAVDIVPTVEDDILLRTVRELRREYGG
jgi:hypothetical protein